MIVNRRSTLKLTDCEIYQLEASQQKTTHLYEISINSSRDAISIKNGAWGLHIGPEKVA